MSKEEIMMSKKIIEYFDGLIKIETDAKEKFKHSPNIQEAADSSIKTLEGCKDTMLYILSQFKQDEQSDAVEFAEWLHGQNMVKATWRDSPRWWCDTEQKSFTHRELYTLFKDEQLKKK